MSMTSAGHGKLGLVAPIRPFREFIEEAAGSKLLLAELRGGRVVESWSAYSGATYVAAVGYSFGGFLRDIVGVRTGADTGPGLTRVDSIALCVSTPGSYYYDPAPTQTTNGVWDDGTNWDDGGYWDDVLVLYVHLEDGSNPNATVVISELGFYFANVGIVHPALSDDRLSGIGSFESWTDVNTPDDWSVTESTWEVKQDTADYVDGASAVKLIGTSSGSASVYVNALPLVSGAVYRLCGEYKTEGDGAATIEVSAAGGATQTAQSDGRTYATSSPVSLPGAGAEWRRFAFDFIAVGSSRLRLGGSGTSGSVRFDKIELRRVWRYVPYEARLASSSVPAASTGSNDIFFGGKRIGTGNISLMNHDGKVEKLLGQLDWSGREVRTFFGGIFRDGNEILVDDYRRTFTGLIQGISADDKKATLQLQDARVLFNVTLPPRVYDDTIYSEMDFTQVGKPRPLWFGVKGNITPTRIGVTANGYGIYEVADCALSPDGIHAISDVHFYESKDAADAQDFTRVISNDASGSHAGELPYYLSSPLGVDISFNVSANATIAGRNNIYKSAGATAWDGGAYSTGRTVTGAQNSYIEGTVGGPSADSNLRLALGYRSSLTTPYDPATSAYAIWLDGAGTGFYHVFIGGVDTYTSTVQPARGDRVRIQMKDGVVTFWVNRNLIYTSVVAPGAGTTYYVSAMLGKATVLWGGVQLYRQSDLRYSVDLANGQFTVLADVGPYRVAADANSFTASHTGSNELQARIPAGLYTAGDLAMVAGAALACADPTSGHNPWTIKGTYNQTTHLTTLEQTSSTFTLEVNSGTWKGLFKSLGFTGPNRAAALTHTSDTPIFTDVDKQHIVRVYGTGFKDDASGTYTGVAGAPIEAGADILRVLATLYMPPVSVDDTSFTFARGRAPEALAVYLNKATSTKEILDTLEFSNIANIVLDGEGKLFYLVYVGDVPDGITDLFDRDFLSFDVDSGVTDVYTAVKVLFDQDPTTGDFTARSATSSQTAIRFGRPDVREFKTYLVNDDNAIAYSTRMLSLASTPSRRISLEARGKLVDKKVGDKIRLTRARAFDPSGKLSARVVRIISISHSYQDGKSKADCVDDVVTVAGYQCVNECQVTCESTCQTGCESVCQSTCEEVCQHACEVSCEGACQGGACQATCQVSCQGGCQGGCQVGCQIGCQTACQVACQTGCQVSCQSGCQVSCQTTCELNCQTSCETSCQTSCELSCQDACQTSCQTDCQFDCQTYKQQQGGAP